MSAAFSIAVLISGNGTNLQSLIDGQRNGELPINLRVVVSNRGDAPGLGRARQAGVPTHVLCHRGYLKRAHYDADLAALLQQFTPDLVVLAGFMRILTPDFISRYEGRLINIHPSLLPAYRGLHTHERVLADGVPMHGCSVHYVTPQLDAGPVIVQARIPVESGDDITTLGHRVQQREHLAYPLAVRWIAEGRTRLQANHVLFDGRPRANPPVIEPHSTTTTF